MDLACVKSLASMANVQTQRQDRLYSIPLQYLIFNQVSSKHRENPTSYAQDRAPFLFDTQRHLLAGEMLLTSSL